MRPWERVALATIAAILLTWWGHNRVTWWTPAGQAIAHQVRGAANVTETLLIPPEAYRNQRVTAAELSQQSRRAQQVLATYFTGKQLRFWRKTARAALDPKNFRHGKSMDWKLLPYVDWVHLNQLDLLPGSTTATATLTREVHNSAGINREDETYHLVDTKAGWRIDGWTMHLEPGYGP